MSIEDIQSICKPLPGVTEDIKWGHDLCFCVGAKMFCVVGLDEVPTSASFKVTDEEFDELSARPGFAPAPYMAKHKWVKTADINNMKRTEWKKYLVQSHQLVAAKLSTKLRNELGL